MVAGRDLVRELKARIREDGPEPTDRAIASRIGMHHVHFSQMKAREELTAAQVANLVLRTDATSGLRARENLIRTVVEFFPLESVVNARGGVHHELFEVGPGQPYRAGLREELSKTYGVYIFYDSRGRALYAGKAKSQTLWREMKNAFNRDRRSHQKLSRVDHPEGREFQRSNEKSRQIVERNVPLLELAHYFSAYEVEPELVDDFEAFLIRAFANDLLNKQKAKMRAARGRTTAKG